MPRLIRSEAYYEIPFSREEVWPILSKTDWINRSIGLPPVRYEFGKGLEAVLQFMNPNAYPLEIMIEGTEWNQDILTAARVTCWQEFRDLFTSEVLSPEEQITVGSQIVLFTDLRGSTAMYQGIGDAPAYVLVRNH